MKRLDFAHLLPPVRNDYAGPSVSLWFLALANLLGTVRGLVHLLAPSWGMRSAGTMLPLLGRQRILELLETGRHSMVVLTAQWGAAELLLALIIWIVLWRYRFLAPLMIAAVIVELAMQTVIGMPSLAVNSPRSGLVSWVVLSVAVVALGVSLLRGDAETGGLKRSEAP